MDLKILILCRGNITRSPFMAGYLHHLYRNSDLADKIELFIDSSGIEGKENLPPHPEVINKGHEIGFDLDLYRSKHSTYRSFEDTDLIFVANMRQYSRFTKNFPNLMHKVFHVYEFGRTADIEWIDFEDPSHVSKITFEEFFSFSMSEIERVWNHIKNTMEQVIAEGKPIEPSLFHKEIDKSKLLLNGYNIFTKRFRPLCPYCQSGKIGRTKRKGLLQMHVWHRFNGYPYRCGSCKKKFILFVGSEIHSHRKSIAKQELWSKFIESEKAAKNIERKP